ncbi:MAG: fatty acyl-AMP ligase [Bacteriovorax sp.]|nr:fatty acyl-AMP ligase [Rhizobacter sp.]
MNALNPAHKGRDIDLSAVNDFATLLARRAQASPERVSLLFLGDGETETERETFASLDEKAGAIAASLRKKAAVGDRILLLFGPGLDFVSAFFGCLYAGMVAVPVHLPRRNQSLDKLEVIATNAHPTVLLATTVTAQAVTDRLRDCDYLSRAALLCVEDAYAAPAADFVRHDVDPASIAFLQYTSGSTGDPKGVMVSHANLIANERVIRQAFLHSHDSVLVGWLPLFHDMGLMGNVLQPIFSGFTSVLMPPAAAIQKPMRVLRAVSTYRGNTCGGPNFFFDLCASKYSVDELARDGTLDLSCWTRAFSGSEPVRHETVVRFSETFAPHGFRRAALYPCYGLAETTLFASGNATFDAALSIDLDRTQLEQHRVCEPVGEALRAAVVSCGTGWPGHDIVIVDPATLETCGADRIGEIWLSGPSVALGYWRNEALTAFAFHAAIAGRPGARYLRTGDLGFMCDGELYVTGRLKEILIIRGRNHYPQDIEVTAGDAHPALRQGGGAAFSIEVDGAEQLCLVHEVERESLRRLNRPEILRAVRAAVAGRHDLQLTELILIRPGELPKTTSGKTRRRACREIHAAHGFQALGVAVDTVSEDARSTALAD